MRKQTLPIVTFGSVCMLKIFLLYDDEKAKDKRLLNLKPIEVYLIVKPEFK
jgi:hypothetical protein